jgi:hypothetical protein
MSKTETSSTNKQYLSIVQGSLRQSVAEGTPDAVRREWEAGGDKGVKHEIVFKAITGLITDVSFFDGDSNGRKFTNLNIVLDANENGKKPVISVGVGTRYASDILKKLPNVKLDEEVRIRPFAFTPEGEDKTVTGVEITQKDRSGEFTRKVDSFFHAKAGDGKTIIKNGFPRPEGDTRDYTSDDWNVFYVQVRRFLVNYTKQHVSPRFERDAARTTATNDKGEEPGEDAPSGIEYPKDEITPDDIPF